MDINTFNHWQVKISCPGITPAAKIFTLFKLHGRSAHEDVGVKLHIKLMFALHEGEWSDSHTSRLSSAIESPLPWKEDDWDFQPVSHSTTKRNTL